MKQSKIHNQLLTAYDIFADDIATIEIITDNDFISISEFTHLINTILGKNCIDSTDIYDNLVSINALSKLSNNPKQKYLASDKILDFCELYECQDYCCYKWSFKFLCLLLNIDFNKPITKTSVNQLCNNIKKYVFFPLDKAIIYNNLKKLQIILNQYYY